MFLLLKFNLLYYQFAEAMFTFCCQKIVNQRSTLSKMKQIWEEKVFNYY